MLARPVDLSKKTARELRSLGATVVIKPLVRIVPTRITKLDVELALKADILMFTSQNAVDIFMKPALSARTVCGSLAMKRFAAVGAGTTGALKKYGFRASYVPDTYTTKSLGRLLAKKIKKGTRIFYPCAKQHNRELVRVLRRSGAIVNPVVVYDITPVRYKSRSRPFHQAKISRRKGWGRGKHLDLDVDYVILTSSMTVRSLFMNIRKSNIDSARTKFICIGPVCARILRGSGFAPLVPENSSVAGIIQLLRRINKC